MKKLNIRTTNKYSSPSSAKCSAEKLRKDLLTLRHNLFLKKNVIEMCKRKSENSGDICTALIGIFVKLKIFEEHFEEIDFIKNI